MHSENAYTVRVGGRFKMAFHQLREEGGGLRGTRHLPRYYRFIPWYRAGSSLRPVHTPTQRGAALETDNARLSSRLPLPRRDVAREGCCCRALFSVCARELRLGKRRLRIETNLRDGRGAQETLFLGRSKELSELLAVLAQLTPVGGRAVIVCGEAGIGKSRLVAESRRRGGREITWAVGHCRREYQAPFAAFHEMLKGIDVPPDVLSEILNQSAEQRPRRCAASQRPRLCF